MEKLPRSALSHEMNAIKNIWCVLSRQVYENQSQFNFVLGLTLVLLEKWEKISSDIISSDKLSLQALLWHSARNEASILNAAYSCASGSHFAVFMDMIQTAGYSKVWSQKMCVCGIINKHFKFGGHFFCCVTHWVPDIIYFLYQKKTIIKSTKTVMAKVDYFIGHKYMFRNINYCSKIRRIDECNETLTRMQSQLKTCHLTKMNRQLRDSEEEIGQKRAYWNVRLIQ